MLNRANAVQKKNRYSYFVLSFVGKIGSGGKIEVAGVDFSAAFRRNSSFRYPAAAINVPNDNGKFFIFFALKRTHTKINQRAKYATA